MSALADVGSWPEADQSSERRDVSFRKVSRLRSCRLTRAAFDPEQSHHIGIVVDPGRNPNTYVKAAARIHHLIRSATRKALPKDRNRTIVTSSAQSLNSRRETS